MLPEVVAQAVQIALGSDVTSEPMPPGRSGAAVWAVDGPQGSFVVRQAGPMARGGHEQTCLKLAAERGVAPRFVYGQPEDGIVIMERITGSMIGRTTSRENDPVGRLAATLRRLHTGPAFPEGPSLVESFHELQGHVGQPLPPELQAAIEDAMPRLLRVGKPAPCHLDLNTSNILDTSERVYLVDWDRAAQSEPFLDVAQVGIWIANDRAERDALLARYLEHSPTAQDNERMDLARRVALAFYSAAFYMVARMVGRPWATDGPDLPALFVEMARTRSLAPPEQLAYALQVELAREMENCAG